MRGATDLDRLWVGIEIISIHAPREGSDSICESYHGTCYEFQSTLPVRGATAGIMLYYKAQDISIHAPREGSDIRMSRRSAWLSAFQSTLPVRGATASKSTLLGSSFNFNPRSP